MRANVLESDFETAALFVLVLGFSFIIILVGRMLTRKTGEFRA